MLPKKGIDIPLLISAVLLVGIGIIMVFSSSYTYALSNTGDGAHYFKRVLMWSGLGMVVLFIFSACPYRLWRKLSSLLMLISIILLVVVLTPAGKEVNNAQRWLQFGGFSFMPSEVAKFAMIIYMADRMERSQHRIKTFRDGCLPHLLLGGILFTLIYNQPDFSTGIIILAVMMVMLFVSGVHLAHFAGLIIAGAASMTAALAYIFMSGHGYKARRLIAYLDPWMDPMDSGLQTIQSLLAIGSGGLTGRGIGKSIQKHLYLPEPQNDFIFAIIG